MRNMRILTAAIASCLLTTIAPAKTEFLDAAIQRYPNIENTVLDSCSLCHSSGTNRNSYGLDYQANDRDFAAIENIDSDNDNFDNIVEIMALTKPGDPSSVPATLHVEKPNGGETLTIGMKAPVRWTTTGNVGTDVSIELWQNGQKVRTLKRTTPNDGKQRVLLKDTLPTGSGFVIKVKSVSDPTISDTSDNGFTIAPATP